ncbi:DNA sulfur modification protein DndB [Microbacterium sp. C23T]
MSIANIDLSAGSYVKAIQINDHMFFTVVNFQQLRNITRDPAVLQPNAAKRYPGDTDLENAVELHELVQRALQGSKKSNVAKYKEYIGKVVNGEPGVLPPIHLWSDKPLNLVTPGASEEAQVGFTTYGLIPTGDRLLSIDGETQLTAHYALDTDPAIDPETKDKHRVYNLGAIVHHGVSLQHARQYFHDLNVLAVRPNTSLGLAMDTQDPLMQVVDQVQHLPLLLGRVDTTARQLPKKNHGSKLVTLQALRQMVVNVAKGIGGIQYGSRPAPLDEVDLEALADVSKAVVGGFFDRFQAEIADREGTIAGAGPVLAAVGAMGNDVLNAPPYDRAHRVEELLDKLTTIDWAKGHHWVGVAGNYTSNGVFSTKGTKEVAYAVYAALNDSSSTSYQRIRVGTPTLSGLGS